MDSAPKLDSQVPRSSSPAAGSSVANAPAAKRHTERPYHQYPFYSPRFWHGMLPGAWFRLLKDGQFRVHPTRWTVVIGVSMATIFNVVFALIQKLCFWRRQRDAELHGTPVFIIGHWRSGTTLLHELMVRDERLSSPSTYQCFAPSHFLATEWFFRRFANWLLPGQRPMDDMAAGWDRPQEDEFALLTLGLPSPYRRIAFPNNGAVNLEYLSFEGVAEDDVNVWLKTLRRFLLNVSVATGRPLVIKSPTHTGRIGYLAKEFPEAKFIHLTRDPRALFPSTCRLWKSLDEIQALQKPSHEHIPSYVVECFERMYAAFHQQREWVAPDRLIDIRYEDLIADPVATLRDIYQTLHLSDFDSVEPIIKQWVETEHQDYQTNQHQLAPEADARIRSHWSTYFERYGYE